MDTRYNHQLSEPKIYQLWEKGQYFRAVRDPQKKSYTIVLPLPNASGKMHIGNVLMIAIEDLLIRWRRMQGDAALWIPGTDHAGFETQVTFERELKKQGLSRFDFDRQTLYQKIWDFVHTNKNLIENQIRQMGASVDWSRYKFSLDPDVVETVNATFIKMHRDHLIYRDDYLVNYCPKCGTTFADLEVVYQERNDPLYYLKYGPFTLATVRPETKFGDTAIAVHPDDKRYQKYIGQTIEVTGLNGKFKLTVIADNYVDPKFGTGVVKITPAHDKNDYEVGKRHHLAVKPVIDLNGRLNRLAGKYAGLTVFSARKQVVEDLKKAGLLVKVDETYRHSVAICYKAGHDIEPTILPNWFIKVAALKKPALAAIKNKELAIFPKWQEKAYTSWLKEMHDWPISRQIVWGIRMPVWYDTAKAENDNLRITFIAKNGQMVEGEFAKLRKQYPLTEINAGLQNLIAPKEAQATISLKKPGPSYLQTTETFDTWFSSGHWPLVTLGYPDSADFKYFYPTAVLETGWEIIRLWVSRMVMFGYYLTGKSPFAKVYLHGLVRALDGRKMSKSLGNIINPDDYLKEYGVDALRMGLISGTATGKDFRFPKDKILAYRNFANKLWNIGRYLKINLKVKSKNEKVKSKNLKHEQDREILKKLSLLIKMTDADLEKFRFAQAAESLYHFAWHEFADKFLEDFKNRPDDTESQAVFVKVYLTLLKLLHPFMPFVTEAIWQEMPGENREPLVIAAWPKPETADL